jgi:hypothetical protein
MVRYFGKAFSKIRTKRSIALLWFDAEEHGLVASEAYTKRLKKRHQKVFAGLGFDMVGIGLPARYCICVYHGPNPSDARKAVPINRLRELRLPRLPEGRRRRGRDREVADGNQRPRVQLPDRTFETRTSPTSPRPGTSRCDGRGCGPRWTTRAITNRGTQSRSWSWSRGAARRSRGELRTPSGPRTTPRSSSTTSRLAAVPRGGPPGDMSPPLKGSASWPALDRRPGERS